MAERRFGPYRLVQQIATGGMAEIHLARTKGIGGFEKFVALKMIHPNYSSDEHFVQMLVDEAKISVQLQHGNIGQVFDLGRVGQTFYITMEYVDGCDLYRVLRKASEQDLAMPIDVAAHIAKEVCMGLDYAHRKRDIEGRALSIVHRDISPQNVLISYASEVKIVDFGIAKASLRARQTAVGVIKGKYYYMSPEQAWGDPLDHRTDIFSAGILLYEMLTGQMLYLEEDMRKLLDMVRKAEIPPPSSKRRDLPRELEAIVMKALARRRDQRFASAHDYGAALERFLHQYAPDFSPGRVGQFVTRVVGPPSPMPQAEDSVPDAGARITRGMGPAELMARDEFSDENSVIFRLGELSGRPASGGGAAASAAAGDPSPRPLGKGRADGTESTTVRPQGLPGAVARSGRPTPASPRLPPGPARMPHVQTPLVPTAGDGADPTVVSSPPAFGPGSVTGTESLFEGSPLIDDPAADHSAETTLARLDPPHAPRRSIVTPATGARVGADDETRLDMDLAQDRTSGAAATDTGRSLGDGDPGDGDPGDGDPGDDADDDLLEAPTRRRRPGERPRLDADGRASPLPAISALNPNRPSRRTPVGGVPIGVTGGASVPGGPAGAAPRPSTSSPMPETTTASLASASGEPSRRLRPPTTPPPLPPPLRDFAPTPTGTAALTSLPGGPIPTSALDEGEGGRGPLGDTLLPFGGTGQVPPLERSASTGPTSAFDPPPLARPYPTPGELSLDDALSGHHLAPSRRGLWLWLIGIVVVGAVLWAIVIMARSGSGGAPTTATIEVISIPPGAKLLVDGRAVAGVTPYKWTDAVPGRKYSLVVEADKHEVWRGEAIANPEGRDVLVIASLKAIVGTLEVESDPAGAEVFLDGRSFGRTPLVIGGVDPFAASAVEVRLRGHKPARETITWDEAHRAKLAFRLDPAR